MTIKSSTSESHIANWYRDQKIFITGSTGFMGKVLVEKLLRDCPDIKTLYLLMRTKRGIEPEQRRDDYINHMVCIDFAISVCLFDNLFFSINYAFDRYSIEFVSRMENNWKKLS